MTQKDTPEKQKALRQEEIDRIIEGLTDEELLFLIDLMNVTEPKGDPQ